MKIKYMKKAVNRRKLRAYDEAIRKAKIALDCCDSASTETKNTIYNIFPELEDERIREEIIDYLKCQSREEPSRKETHNKWIAWLKKVIIPSYNDIDSSFIEDIKNVINEAPLLMQSDKEKMISWLEKQGKVELDNDDIEVEEKGIREAFNKIEDEKQGKQKSQRMISAEAKEAMYDKPANTVEQKCEESKTKIFDAPTPFEDKLYAFVLACEILVDPSKREFILEHSQEILDAAKEQIGKEQSSTWSKEDEEMLVDAYVMLDWYKGNNWWTARHIKDWLKSLKERIGG